MELLYYGYAIKAYQKKIESLAEGSTGQMEMNLHHFKERNCNQISNLFKNSA